MKAPSSMRLWRIRKLRSTISELRKKLQQEQAEIRLKPGSYLRGAIVVHDVPEKRVRSHLRKAHVRVVVHRAVD